MADPPEGSPTSRETWERTQSAFEEGAAVNTDDTVYLGFGLEQLATRPPTRAGCGESDDASAQIAALTATDIRGSR